MTNKDKTFLIWMGYPDLRSLMHERAKVAVPWIRDGTFAPNSVFMSLSFYFHFFYIPFLGIAMAMVACMAQHPSRIPWLPGVVQWF